VLKYSTLDREIARRQKALSRIKKHLVHKDYDSSSIWSAASSQICRGLRQTTAQSQACRAMMARPPLTDWLCSTPVARGELKKIIWIKPAKSRDPCVSNIALETVNALCMSDEVPQGLPISEGAPVILHSVHQTELFLFSLHRYQAHHQHSLERGYISTPRLSSFAGAEA
jgi:hypothetical protein